jgi:integrase/recombinase XerD
VGGVLRLPAVRNELAARILPEADVHRMLSLETNDRNRAVLTLLNASAIRVSELCTLCWKVQANGDGGQITVLGKGNKARSVQLPQSVWKMLQEVAQRGRSE